MAQHVGYKEDISKGKMLRFEDSLPKLPVPTLEGKKVPTTYIRDQANEHIKKPQSATSSHYILSSLVPSSKPRKRQSRNSLKQVE
jgi:hypothetical protein